MANTLTLNKYEEGAHHQFQGAFSRVWTVKATWADQDAVSVSDTMSVDLSVPGVALGDMVLGVCIDNDQSDGTDQYMLYGVVTAANTLTIRTHADAGQAAADDMNGKVVKALVGRPAW